MYVCSCPEWGLLIMIVKKQYIFRALLYILRLGVKVHPAKLRGGG